MIVFVQVSAFALVTYAAIAQFGWLNGLAIAAAVWLLAPYQPSR